MGIADKIYKKKLIIFLIFNMVIRALEIKIILSINFINIITICYSFIWSIIALIIYVVIKKIDPIKNRIIIGSFISAFVFVMVYFFLLDTSPHSARTEEGWYIEAGKLTSLGWHYLSYYFLIELANYALTVTGIFLLTKTFKKV